jgi:hypothetical protein
MMAAGFDGLRDTGGQINRTKCQLTRYNEAQTTCRMMPSDPGYRYPMRVSDCQVDCITL